MMISNLSRTKQPARFSACIPKPGTTIIEVLFAIGIMMIGLVGIASLIPLAARQASDSRVLTQGTSLSQNAYRTVMAMSMHVPSVERPWLICEDDPNVNSLSGVGAFGQPGDYYARWNAPAFIPIRSFAELVQYQAGKEFTFFDSDSVRSAGFGARFSYCLDPLFMAAQPVAPSAVGSEAGYRRSRFPHYRDTFNPLSNPVSPEHDWISQPRMIRVTFPEVDSNSSAVVKEAGTGVNVPMRPKLVERLFSNMDNMTVLVNSEDRSLNSVRGYNTVTDLSGDQSLAQVSNNQDLSWMATLSPLEQDTLYTQNTFTMSVVVFNNRDRTFAAPIDSQGVAADPSSLPTGEIVAWVAPVIFPSSSVTAMGSVSPYDNEYKFGGANGFNVNLYGYAGPGMVDSSGELRRELKIKAGTWIMLSRRFYFSETTGDSKGDLARSKDIFKWYRVVGVGAVAEILPNNTPPSNQAPVLDAFGNTMTQAVWRQQVQLVGPDWSFRDMSDSLKLPTTATIVPGVISVYERIIEMPIY